MPCPAGKVDFRVGAGSASPRDPQPIDIAGRIAVSEKIKNAEPIGWCVVISPLGALLGPRVSIINERDTKKVLGLQ
jgi:hypothetical protein